MNRFAIAAAAFFATTTCVYAVPVTITQTFRNVNYDNYNQAEGVGWGQIPTGDWIFKGTLDSNSVDAVPEINFGAFQLTGLTLTQASLGLFDVRITNANVLFFYLDSFGFSNDPPSDPPWTAIAYQPNYFSDVETLEQYVVLLENALPNKLSSRFGPQFTGFLFDDGRRLYGWGAGTATVTVTRIPEPTSVALAFTATIAALCLRRRSADLAVRSR